MVPSAFALARLRELGAPLGDRARVIPSVQRTFAAALVPPRLAATRSPPGGCRRRRAFADAIAGCAAAGVPLVVAGDGPQAEELRAAPALTCASRAA